MNGNTVSIPNGANRTPRPGTIRHWMVEKLASPAGLTAEDCYAKMPRWNKRHVAEAVRILVKDYGYAIVKGPDGVYRIDPAAEPAAEPAATPAAEPAATPAAEPAAGRRKPSRKG